MSFNMVRPPKGSEIVQQHLLNRIVSGEYSPGSRLPTVADLASGYDVGRSTIREALSALKAMGYIDIKHGGGTFVSKQLPTDNDPNKNVLSPSMDSLREVIEARKYIESGCSALAAERRTEEDLEALDEIIQLMINSVDDETQSEVADAAFHLQIAKASHNLLMIQLMESLNQRMSESIGESRKLWFYSERASAERLLAEHLLIYEAIKTKDAVLASNTMLQHLSKVEQVIKKHL